VALVGYPLLPRVAFEPRAVNNFRRTKRAGGFGVGARVTFMPSALVWNRPVAGSAASGPLARPTADRGIRQADGLAQPLCEDCV